MLTLKRQRPVRPALRLLPVARGRAGATKGERHQNSRETPDFRPGR